MTTTAEEYGAAQAPLDELIGALGTPEWQAPSPCEGWSARDVLRHLVQTQREFLAERRLDAGPEPDIEADPAAAWAEHTSHVRRLLADPAVPATEFDGYFGRTTVGDTFQRFYVWDMLVHRWDIATAAGRETRFTPPELDRIGADLDDFAPTMYQLGLCRPGVEAPPGASPQLQLLARLGRRAW